MAGKYSEAKKSNDAGLYESFNKLRNDIQEKVNELEQFRDQTPIENAKFVEPAILDAKDSLNKFPAFDKVASPEAVQNFVGRLK